jgi:arabinofuranosyltransferase
VQGALFAVPLAAYALASWAHRNILDDGFIYLRVVHSVTGGHGPVFNVGQRVEAFTSPLWLGILSVADLLAPVRLEWIAVFVGMAATLAGLGFALAGSARLIRQLDADALLIPFGLLVVVSLTPMWFYATSGLETGLAFLWLGLSLWTLATWSTWSTRMSLAGAFVLGLGWLVRPELLIYSVVFLAMVLFLQWRHDSWRRRVQLLGVAFALPVAYQIFRMGYYGALVANTGIVKEGTRLNFGRGWTYLSDFVTTYWFVVPLVLLLVGGYAPLALGLRRAGRGRAVWVLSGFLTAVLLNALYIVAVGGDYEHARLLLPAVFGLCAPIAAIPATRRYVVALASVPWILAAMFVFRPPGFRLGSTYLTPPVGRVTTDDQGWGGGSANSAIFTDDGLYLQNPPRLDFYRTDIPFVSSVKQPEVAAFAVGIMPYAIGDRLFVLDLYGLADPITARMTIPTNSGLIPYPGQEKPLPQPWITARLVPEGVPFDKDALQFHNYSIIPKAKGPALDEQVRWARAALDCAPIEKLERSTEAPLTIGRFLHNIVDSFSNTSLRIPADPETAYKKLCGTTSTPSTSDQSSVGAPAGARWIASDDIDPPAPGPGRAAGALLTLSSSRARPRADRIVTVAGFV